MVRYAGVLARFHTTTDQMSADLLQELESTKASLRRAISDRDQLQTRVRELEHGRAASTAGDATAWVGELSSILALENLLT